MWTKYGRIAHELREMINSGKYRPGDLLPKIPDLMEQYDVARDTVRDALAELRNQGLVATKAGIGTVVRETTPIGLAYSPAMPAQTWDKQAGAEAFDKVIVAEWQQADKEIAGKLRISPGDRVVHRIRHQGKGRDVAQVHEQWISGAMAEAIKKTSGTDLADLGSPQKTDLFTLSAQAGHAPVETTETLSCRMPDPDERDLLGLTTGVPVLITMRTTVEAGEKPIETSVFVGAGDRMSTSFTVALEY